MKRGTDQNFLLGLYLFVGKKGSKDKETLL